MTGLLDPTRRADDSSAMSDDSSASRRQSLADGSLVDVLLHVDRAVAGVGGWDQVQHGLAAAVADGVQADDECGLFRGAPAVAFVLHTAATTDSQRLDRARETLDRAVAALAHRRVDRALERIDRGEPPHMAEYDVINGLTGIGAHLLAQHPRSDALGRILDYLVALTRPVLRDRQWWPGWWTAHSPYGTLSPQFPHGHANLGLAHGITGPLALLALAARHGISVDDHREAINRIGAELDHHRHDDEAGSWWPQWIVLDQHRPWTRQRGPVRPSWCYGTPGIARALHLAGIATHDSGRRTDAEHAVAACLADADQLRRLTDDTVCHGWAGLALTAWRTATDAGTDARTSPLAPHLHGLVDQLFRPAGGHHAGRDDDAPRGPHRGRAEGLLEGRRGVELVLDTIARAPSAGTRWDRCLLIT